MAFDARSIVSEPRAVATGSSDPGLIHSFICSLNQ